MVDVGLRVVGEPLDLRPAFAAQTPPVEVPVAADLGRPDEPGPALAVPRRPHGEHVAGALADGSDRAPVPARKAPRDHLVLPVAVCEPGHPDLPARKRERRRRVVLRLCRREDPGRRHPFHHDGAVEERRPLAGFEFLGPEIEVAVAGREAGPRGGGGLTVHDDAGGQRVGQRRLARLLFPGTALKIRTAARRERPAVRFHAVARPRVPVAQGQERAAFDRDGAVPGAGCRVMDAEAHEKRYRRVVYRGGGRGERRRGAAQRQDRGCDERDGREKPERDGERLPFHSVMAQRHTIRSPSDVMWATWCRPCQA